jgi:hypothetical protein
MEITGGECVVKVLEYLGVERVFGILTHLVTLTWPKSFFKA